MKNFEKWQEEQKEASKNLLIATGICAMLGFTLIKIDWPILGWICLILAILFFYSRQTAAKSDEATYQKELTEEKEQKAERAKERAAQKKAEEKQIQEQKAADIAIEKKFQAIQENVDKLMAIEAPKPIDFKKNLNQYEKDIVSKGNAEYLHKFVKISSFLNDLWKHLDDNRKGIYEEFDVETLTKNWKIKKESEKNRSIEDIHRELKRKADGDFRDYSADGLLRQLKDVSQKSLKVFPKEFAQVVYLEAMANSMLIFLLEDKQILFFEILEAFDKLGALDSSWQKSVSNKMSNIESKLDILISGISNLNDNVKVLIEKGDEISEQLQGIDSRISANNVLQAITAYQVYKINKNTKSLGN